MESNFVDYVKIQCRSGKGGRGSMHLRHVKYNPNGGPDGGDGGKGGSIILRGNHNYWTLLHLKYQRHFFAEHGGNGGRGGLGNFQFRSATNQAPRYAQPGEPMQEMTVIMELKLLADVGPV